MYFFFYSFKTFIPFNYHFNYLDYLLFLKKNNNYFKKISINNLKNNFFYSCNYIYKFYKKQNLLKFNNNNSINNNNNLKLIDLKKKFYSNFFQYINFYNMLKNNKKITKKKNKITDLFLKFNCKINNYYLLNYQLFNILINSKFILNYLDYIYLLANNFIFINRKFIKIKNIKLIYINKNVIIELIFFKFYYNYILKIKKFTTFYKNINFNYSNNLFIYKNKYLKKYINNNYFFFNKIINLEIDYKSLSLFVLFNYFYNLYNVFNIKHFWINIFLINIKKI